MKCLLGEDSGWVCEEHPIGRGKDRTPAPVARLVRHALTVTVPRTSRRGCRKALSLMSSNRGADARPQMGAAN
jgi:hypothetical protein